MRTEAQPPELFNVEHSAVTGAARFTTHKPRPQQVHANSIEAYRAELPKLSKRAETILFLFESSRLELTDRDVMERLGFREPNAVRPRITELIDAGRLIECGKTKDAVTGKTVRVTRYNKHTGSPGDADSSRTTTQE